MYFPSTKPLFTLLSRGCLDPRHCFCFDLIYNLGMWWVLLSGWQDTLLTLLSITSQQSGGTQFPSEEDRKVFAVIKYFWFWLMSGARLHLSFFLWSFDGIRWATLVFTFHLSCFRFVTDDRIPESEVSRDLLLLAGVWPTVHSVHHCPLSNQEILNFLQDWAGGQFVLCGIDESSGSELISR